jgi:cyclopropane fatty-acyl-phospholipid synthase-like methyltransferase
MIIISPLLDSFVKYRLKNKAYRLKMYTQALEKKLRLSKMGRIILRNMGEVMAANPLFHEEFANMQKNGNYQKMFWESDLGFLWYEGNLNAKNEYFELAKNEIMAGNCQTVLDVGCGWGRFCAEVSQMKQVTKVVGIDISKDIIQQAKEKHQHTSVIFKCEDILEETESYDLITIFGSTDYISPDVFEHVLEHVITKAKKEVLLVNSLRNIPFEKTLQLERAIEVKRYDDGYVQPLNHLLRKLQQQQQTFRFEIRKFGMDSALVTILKS